MTDSQWYLYFFFLSSCLCMHCDFDVWHWVIKGFFFIGMYSMCVCMLMFVHYMKTCFHLFHTVLKDLKAITKKMLYKFLCSKEWELAKNILLCPQNIIPVWVLLAKCLLISCSQNPGQQLFCTLKALQCRNGFCEFYLELLLIWNLHFKNNLFIYPFTQHIKQLF